MKLVNKTGYLKGAKTAKNPVNIIPSSLITTQGMAFPIKANGKTLYPNTGQYKFPTSYVVETPLKQKGVNKLEGDLISKVVMNRNKDKDFVKRTKATNMFKTWDDFDTKATHKMGYGEDNKGQSYMFPTIMNPNNEAIKVPNQYADYISSEGYKKATGMSYQGGSTKLKAGPVLKNAVKKYSKPIPAPKPVSKKEQLEDNDSWLEKAFEPFDRTGLSSWDNVYRSYKNTGLSKETGLETLGAIPLLGRISRLSKPGVHLTKYSKAEKALQNILPKNKTFSNTAKGLGLTGRALDFFQNIQGSKDKSGFKYNPNAKDNTLTFNGRNILPTFSSENMYKKGSKGVSLAFSRGEKDPKGGLTQKGVDKYNRATGGNLKMAVTTPPSKLKAGSKAANRRKSFCSRMKGMKSKLTSAKTANDPNSRINKSLRKWNC